LAAGVTVAGFGSGALFFAPFVSKLSAANGKAPLFAGFRTFIIKIITFYNEIMKKDLKKGK